MKPRRKWAQLGLAERGRRGGCRPGAGRKRVADRTKLKGHRERPPLASRYPVHVTLKVRSDVPYLRKGHCFRAIRSAFAAGKEKDGFRLVHFTVQGNHLHLLVEAHDRSWLTKGMQGLAVRIARRLNAKLGRRGRVFAERYHARILRTPTEVRRTLAYVLNNSRKHSVERRPRDWLDDCSSAAFFDGWRWRPRVPRDDEPPPVVPPRTWLLQTGWRRGGGLIAPDEVPS